MINCANNDTTTGKIYCDPARGANPASIVVRAPCKATLLERDMCEISLNLENRHGVPFRDDASATLNDAEFFVSKGRNIQFRLTAASSTDLLRGRIILKKGRRGARLALLSLNDHGALSSQVVAFQLKESEISALSGAADKILLATWRQVMETRRWIPIDDQCWSTEELNRASATAFRGKK